VEELGPGESYAQEPGGGVEIKKNGGGCELNYDVFDIL
jgi:hypothetical protein